jgi:DNA-binding NarL/FixJ family response regulator
MINIAIIDQNRTFRESLKTLLEQIQDFRVVFNTGETNYLENLPKNAVQVLLVDNAMGREKCNELIDAALSQSNHLKALILAMYKDELNLDSGEAEVMLKCSSKKEFENRIKKLASECIQRSGANQQPDE